MSEILPRCTHFFGYCDKRHPPKGKPTDRQDEGENFRVTPKCKLDWRTCEDYRTLVMTMEPLPQSSSTPPAEAPAP